MCIKTLTATLPALTAPISCRIPCSSGHRTWTAIWTLFRCHCGGHINTAIVCMSVCLAVCLLAVCRCLFILKSSSRLLLHAEARVGARTRAGVGVIALSLHFKSMMSRCEANEKEAGELNYKANEIPRVN